MEVCVSERKEQRSKPVRRGEGGAEGEKGRQKVGVEWGDGGGGYYGRENVGRKKWRKKLVAVFTCLAQSRMPL
jgi:hypothetical protein